MGAFLTWERQGAVVTLKMSRPETRNAISDHDAIEDFTENCARIAGDISVRAVILTGEGNTFSSGGNIKAMRALADTEACSPLEIRDRYRTGIQRIPLALYHLEVPVIAAVNGAAIGAGMDLACMCDLRIAAESATFAESFVRLGIVPGDGGAWLLPRIVGISVASEMLFTGSSIDAQTALQHGLVSRVVPAADLLAHANELAGRIANNPGTALRLTKKLMREAQHMRLESALEMSAALQALAHHTTEHRDAMAVLLASHR
ncbi:crotonase/enoyl-CoA hydratase family protein [Paraburkholderia sp.]|uniref:crotonase/enoyl-CoA hydratase family protein n=1 Tax=Paraburkholderia sp. TaxID=1926495 RepID=UPI003D6E166A